MLKWLSSFDNFYDIMKAEAQEFLHAMFFVYDKMEENILSVYKYVFHHIQK